MIPTPQYTNYLMSSVLLWLDNKILTKSNAHASTNTRFYPVRSPFYGYQCYASPYCQFIADSSVTNTTIPSGVYINNTFCATGQGGLVNIDFLNGRIYTTGLSNPSISGTFSIKYFNIKFTDEPEEKILVETAYNLRPKPNQPTTGLNINETNFPVIFVKHNGGYNSPLALNGLDNSVDFIRLIILADSDFALNSISSICRDTSQTLIPVLGSGQMPFNIMGGLVSGSYNYTTLTTPATNNLNMAFIKNVYEVKYNQSYVDIRRIDPQIYWSIIDLEIESYRYPRL